MAAAIRCRTGDAATVASAIGDRRRIGTIVAAATTTTTRTNTTTIVGAVAVVTVIDAPVVSDARVRRTAVIGVRRAAAIGITSAAAGRDRVRRSGRENVIQSLETRRVPSHFHSSISIVWLCLQVAIDNAKLRQRKEQCTIHGCDHMGRVFIVMYIRKCSF